jgi:hypothetical protein
MPIKQTFILGLIAGAACLRAASLAQLIPQSDAIVLGSQSSVAVVGTMALLSISVERVFTGNVGVGSEIAATWNIQHVAFPIPSGSYTQRGIWFLQRAADGGWACIPAASYGNKKLTLADLPLPVSTGPLPSALAYDPSNTALLDQLVFEVAATQPSDPKVLLNSLGGSSSASVTQALHYIAGNRAGDLGLMGLSALVGQGDIPSLLQVEQMAGTLAMTSYGAQMLVSTIGGGFRNPDPSGVASLGRMATSPNSPAKLQLAATQALKAIHTAAALPYLGLIAMGHSAQLQLLAAQGISFFANGIGIPTSANAASMAWLGSGQPSSYATPETKQHLGYQIGQGESSYIAYWQSWWQQHPELR